MKGCIYLTAALCFKKVHSTLRKQKSKEIQKEQLRVQVLLHVLSIDQPRITSKMQEKESNAINEKLKRTYSSILCT